VIKKQTTKKSEGNYAYTQKISVIEAAKVYAQLRRDVTNANVLERDYFYYLCLGIFTFGGFFLTAGLLVIIKSPFIFIPVSLIFSFFSVQIAGILHDSVHRAVFKSPRNNDILGYFCAAAIAFVYNSFKSTHNLHHARPNQEDEDPDIEIPFIALNRKLYDDKTGIQKQLIKYQMYLYYPLTLLVSFSNRLGSTSYFRKNKRLSEIWWQIIVYSIGAVIWFIFPFIFFPISKALILFLLANGSMGFYLGNIFAPNHKGMPMLKKNQKLSFLEQQIITSRNIKGGTLTDIVLLGLNYQTEHHLFPECPRNKLKLITPYVKEVCKKLNLEYTEVSLIKSNKIILNELSYVAKLA
jgi:fatty acid desaturase